MPLERASVFETVQIGAESLAAPGVAVAATKRLQAIGLMPKPKTETSRYRPSGFKVDTLTIPGKDSTEIDVSGKLDYANIVYPLASVLGSTTPATAGTNGKEWTFALNTTGPDVMQTYTLDAGSAVRAERVTNVVFSELGLSFKRDAVDVSGKALGKLFADGTYLTGSAVYTLTLDPATTGGTYTLTVNAQTTAAIAYDATADAVQAAIAALANVGPADVVVTGGPGPAAPYTIVFTGALFGVAVTATGTFTGLTPGAGSSALTSAQAGQAISDVVALPVTPGAVNVYVDTDFADIGTTKLTRVYQADLNIGGRFNPIWPLNSAETSWAALVETAPDLTAKLKMQANGAGMAYLSTLRAGSTVYLRIESVGPALPAPDAGLNYLFRWDMAAKVENLDDLADADGAMSVDFTFRGVHDADFGGVCTAFVRNLQAAL